MARPTKLSEPTPVKVTRTLNGKEQSATVTSDTMPSIKDAGVTRTLTTPHHENAFIEAELNRLNQARVKAKLPPIPVFVNNEIFGEFVGAGLTRMLNDLLEAVGQKPLPRPVKFNGSSIAWGTEKARKHVKVFIGAEEFEPKLPKQKEESGTTAVKVTADDMLKLFSATPADETADE